MCWEKLYAWHKNPVNAGLHMLSGIILIFALWNHSWMWIVVSLIIAAIGHMIQASSRSKRKRRK